MARVARAKVRVIALLIGALALAAGARYLLKLRTARRRRAAALDDAAIREIERTGRLQDRDPADDAPLDLDAIAEAEEEFWAEGWDEPEEYER